MNQGYCLQYLLDYRRRSYMGWFIAIHQISEGIIWFKNQPACSINGNFTWAEALSMLVVFLVKIPVVFTALDYHQSIEIPTFHAHHLTHCGIPHAPKHSVISPDVFGALVVCFRGRNLYVYMPIHIRSQYLGLAIFAPPNCESIIKYQTKKATPIHTWHANVANGALRILCTWAGQKEGQLWTTHMPRIGKTHDSRESARWFPT